MAIVTSSPVQQERLGQVSDGWVSWLGDLDRSVADQFFVLAVSDVEDDCSSGGGGDHHGRCIPTVRCDPRVLGEQVRHPLQDPLRVPRAAARAPPSAVWYLRLMDDTLVLPRNLLGLLLGGDQAAPTGLG